ncbi:MAG: TetR family transcriptional regulator C-terminal domain-containing protein [Butyrivibrio sp.]|nr:TetR family transcriptional regulator C-terminal domain-containing protein [Butyrivibrio sp.]
MSEKKEDGRIRYTKMRIRSAFYELAKETEYEKITVTAVCNKAEINRATFYKHYLDIPDLIDKLQEEAIERLLNRLDTTTPSTMDDFLVDLLKQVKENVNSCDGIGLFTQATASNFTSKVSRIIYSRFSNIIKCDMPQIPDLNQDMIFAYVAGGCAGIIDYWAKTGFKESEKNLAQKLRLMSYSTIQSIGKS